MGQKLTNWKAYFVHRKSYGHSKLKIKRKSNSPLGIFINPPEKGTVSCKLVRYQDLMAASVVEDYRRIRDAYCMKPSTRQHSTTYQKTAIFKV